MKSHGTIKKLKANDRAIENGGSESGFGRFGRTRSIFLGRTTTTRANYSPWLAMAVETSCRSGAMVVLCGKNSLH
jgi:hypothetical protein